jgi:hypothetical protein
MKKIILFVALMLSLMPSFFAQTKSFFCKNHNYLKTYGLEKAEQKSYSYLVEKSKTFELDERSKITIPIVFHVVYSKEIDNIADSIILKALKTINEDFQGNNKDLKNLRPLFKNIAGSMDLEFQLHKIIRKKTDTNFGINGSDTTAFGVYKTVEAIKFTDKGGSNPLNPATFLNVWIGKFGFFYNGKYEDSNMKLAFAFPPLQHPQWADTIMDSVILNSKGRDGVVISKNMLEYTNESNPDAMFIKSRVLSHEIGHYLGLRHIFSEDNLNEKCIDTDLLQDTPTANYEFTTKCNDTLNTCINQGEDFPDLWENYMDYSKEVCKNMFTKQQVQLMQTCLAIYRPKLRIEFVENTNNSTFQIYPNPSSGFFNISIAQNAVIQVFNAVGHLILKKEISDGSDIDLSNTTAGIYFYQIQSIDNQEIIKKGKLVKL